MRAPTFCGDISFIQQTAAVVRGTFTVVLGSGGSREVGDASVQRAFMQGTGLGQTRVNTGEASLRVCVCVCVCVCLCVCVCVCVCVCARIGFMREKV
jgi:hypothetical protein